MSDNKTPNNNQPNEEQVIFDKKKPEPKFAVNLQVFLELNIKNKHMRATANVLGWQRPKHLLVSYPLVENRALVAPTQTELVVRYLLDGTVYGFNSKIVHKQQEPLPMWVLSYPSIVETKTLRRSPRIPIALPVKCSDDTQARTVDISAHGALLVVNSTLAIGDTLTISFTLPDDTKIQNLEVTVVRVQQSRDESMVGVNFDEKNKEQINKISGYLYEHEIDT